MKNENVVIVSCPPCGENGGFTLIELLVVVLIIGILAAVALPQYKLAVVRSKTKAILPILSAIQRAQEVYYLNNGEYVKDIQSLDIQMPAECTPINSTTNTNWICGKDFHVVTNTYGAVIASYCPGYNNTVTTCNDNRDFSIRWAFDHCTEENCGKEDSKGYPKERLCKVRNNSVLGTKICNSFVFN